MPKTSLTPADVLTPEQLEAAQQGESVFTPSQLLQLRQQIGTLARLNAQLRLLKYRARTGLNAPGVRDGGVSRGGRGRGRGGRGGRGRGGGLVLSGGRGRGRGRGRGTKRGREDESEEDDSIVVRSSEEEEDEEEEAMGSSGSEEEEEEGGEDASADTSESEEDYSVPVLAAPRRTGRQRRPSSAAAMMAKDGSEEEEEEMEAAEQAKAAEEEEQKEEEEEKAASEQEVEEGQPAPQQQQQSQRRQKGKAAAGKAASGAGSRGAEPQGPASPATSPSKPPRSSGGGGSGAGGKRKGLFMLVSEAPSADAPLKLQQMKPVDPFGKLAAEEDAVCSVCGDGEAPDGNLILLCEGKGCSVAVHQQCYGVKTVPEGEWLCDACKAKLSPAAANCCVCPVVGCALKKVTRLGRVVPAGKAKPGRLFCHLACTLWVPEIELSDVESFSGIQLDKLTAVRVKLRCELCKQAGGGAVQCAMGTCCRSFHVLCGRAAGQQLHFRATDGEPMAFCELHSRPAFANWVDEMVEGKRPLPQFVSPVKEEDEEEEDE